MTLSFAVLLIGLALIIKGGDAFVAAAIRIAQFLNMPRVVIGSTLVSLTTTTPEMVVSIMAGLKGEPGLAVGNAVGSCICNIGLILGITATIRHVDIHIHTLRTPLIAMFCGGLILFIMTLDLEVSREQGAFLIVLGLAYFAWDFWNHWRSRKPAEAAEAAVIEKEVTTMRWPWLHTRAGTVVQFIFGALVVVFGSRLLVDAASDVALRLGVPSIFLGLTIVAVGTSLPELTTAVTSTRKAVSDLAIGNVLGANIANLTLIVGIAAVLHEVRMDRVTQLFNFPAMLVIMLALLWMLFTDRRVTRREGSVLLSAYTAYLILLGIITAFGSAASRERPQPILFSENTLLESQTWLVDSGTNDPRRVFTVTNGVLRISGDGLGYLGTLSTYSNFTLRLEYRWGSENTRWGGRIGKARDSGVFLHAFGPDGNSVDGNGAFMAAIECNVMEGATGDFLLIRGRDPASGTLSPKLLSTTRSMPDRDGWWTFSPDGEAKTLTTWGRLNWRNKSADWKDVTGFRGPSDVERPGDWNELEIRCHGQTIETRLNGVLVNRAAEVSPTFGRILLQCEGSEIFFRRATLTR